MLLRRKLMHAALLLSIPLCDSAVGTHLRAKEPAPATGTRRPAIRSPRELPPPSGAARPIRAVPENALHDPQPDSVSTGTPLTPTEDVPRDEEPVLNLRLIEEPDGLTDEPDELTAPQLDVPPHMLDAEGTTLAPQMVELRSQVRTCLAEYFAQPVNLASHSPWGVMHASIAFGVDSEILVNGQRVNAIGWLCWNNPCRGQRLLSVREGRIDAEYGVGLEGHAGQFLAILAQSRVPGDFELRAEGRRFTVRDLAETEMRTCQAGTELTFKLIGLSHYLPSDTTWKNDRGETWSIPRLIQEEIKQPIVGSACGGTHRLMGLSYAVRRRQKAGEPIDGQWLRAKKYTDDYINFAYRQQNPDGSFSSNWFEARSDWGGARRKLQTTGHILEWLVFAVPQEDLTDPRIVRAIDFLSTLMLEEPHDRWEIGPLGHAIHALVLYDERAFGAKPGERRELLAQETAASDHK